MMDDQPMPAAADPAAEPVRRPYQPPRLSVHGTVVDLTLDLPEAKAGTSDLT